MEHSEFREEIELDGHPTSYDHSEPKASALFIFGGATIALVLLVTLGVTFYYDSTREQRIYSTVLAVDNDQLQNLRTMEAKELHTYGYVDEKAGKVRLPIEKAMEILAQESAGNRLKYPTNAYAVKTPEQLVGQVPAVSQAGAAAVVAGQDAGTGSSPNAQPMAPVKK